MDGHDIDAVKSAQELRKEAHRNAVAQFRRHGMNASFHYACDGAGEFYLAMAERNKALAIYDAFPEAQAEMRKEAHGFLWSYEFSRMRPE